MEMLSQHSGVLSFLKPFFYSRSLLKRTSCFYLQAASKDIHLSYPVINNINMASVSTKFLSLPRALLMLVFSFVLSAHASQSTPIASPEARTNLVCHTNDPAECYPTIFAPTKSFQRIHDDQSIPPGLHVRMNLATGLKEARLNIPEEDGGGDSAVVVIDNSSTDTQDSAGEDGQGEPMNVQNPELMLSEVDDSPPEPRIPVTQPLVDNQSLDQLIESISEPHLYRGGAARLKDIADLTELAHDIEWGLAISQNKKLSNCLWAIITAKNTTPDPRMHITELRSAATLLLGTAVQNNPQALKSLLENFSIEFPSNDDQPATVISRQLEAISSGRASDSIDEADMIYASRLVFLVSQIANSDRDQLEHFTQHEGLEILNRLFQRSFTARSTKLSTKIANFVIDHAAAILQLGGDNGLADFCELSLTYLVANRTDQPGVASVCESRKALEGLLGDRCGTVKSTCAVDGNAHKEL